MAISKDAGTQLVSATESLSIAKEKKPPIEAGWTPPYLVRPRVNSSNGKSIVCYDHTITIIVDMEFTIPNSNSKGLSITLFSALFYSAQLTQLQMSTPSSGQLFMAKHNLYR